MALSDLVSAGLEGPVSAVRRFAFWLSIAIVAAAAALIYAASAMLLAVEILLGPIGARLAVALVLFLIAVAGYFAPRMMRQSAPAHDTAADKEMENLSRDQRIAMVLEALMLGFSMGSRKPADNTDSSK